MRTEIQAIHFKADQSLKDFISKKLEKLTKFYDGIVSSHVYLKVNNNHGKANKMVEIKINVQNQSLMKTHTAESFEAATDIAVDALATQVKRYKEKLQSVA